MVPTPAFVEIQGEGQDYNCYAPTPEFREKQGLAIVMTDLKFPVASACSLSCFLLKIGTQCLAHKTMHKHQYLAYHCSSSTRKPNDTWIIQLGSGM